MNFFRDLKTKTKLMASFAVVIIFLVGLGALSITRVMAMKGMIQSIYDDRLVPLVDLGKINTALSGLRMGALKIVNEADVARRQAIWSEANKEEAEINALIDKYGATYLVPEEKKVFEEFKPAWREYDESRTRTYKAALDGNFEYAKQNAATDAAVKFKAADAKLQRLLAIQDEVAKQLYKDSDAMYRRITAVIIVATIIAILIAAGLIILLTSMIARPLAVLTGVADRLSQGDLTAEIEVKGKDETGQLLSAMKNMVDKLRSVVTDVRTVSDNVASGSQELSSGAQQISHGATEQAASIEETSSSMEEMTSNIRQKERQGGGRDRKRHEGDSEQDIHNRGDSQANQPPGPERGHRGGAGRRARQGVRRRGLRGEEARRKEPDRRRGDKPSVLDERPDSGEGRGYAHEACAGHPEDLRARPGDNRGERRAE
ncbi:MAG: methyl-accepting chemotaxis protein [Deltaproteobacteria bacterium]|nr:methyl-accepting chemotaxis protein [Deltaproteobacteria bacterium]